MAAVTICSDFGAQENKVPTRVLRPWDFPGKSTGVGEFNSDEFNSDAYLLLRAGIPQKKWSSHHGQQKIAVLGWNLKNDRMISVRFQGKPFISQQSKFMMLPSNAEEAEVEWF